MEWSYGEDVRGWWFCLSGSSVTEFQYQGLRIAGNRRGADVVEIRNICEGGLVYTPSAFPASVPLIYRVMAKSRAEWLASQRGSSARRARTPSRSTPTTQRVLTASCSAVADASRTAGGPVCTRHPHAT